MQLDEGAWVALGFAIFVILVWKKAGAALREMLDARSDKIRTELEEAEALRKEAKAQLDSFKGMKKEAEEEAKNIIANANLAAKRIRENAAAKAEENIARREAQAAEKIKASEAAMVGEIKAKTAHLAAQAARQIITDKLDEKTALQLIDQSVEQIAAHK
ncbi:MAG: F0F1 ATP synthase subunit B [Candidatus Puniceispirillaceae bacterium]|jgi:F-type H+-transporting ATPase subunit b|nr:ATP synthase F0 subunit B [Pseudomonadota bacterium]